MGRYVTGDWEWKFAFGDQSSSFGEVLQNICQGTENCLSRYVGTGGEGEQLELYVENPYELIEAINTYIGKGFKPKCDIAMREWSKCNRKFGDPYWDKLMMQKFLKDIDLKTYNGEYLTFHVEY